MTLYIDDKQFECEIIENTLTSFSFKVLNQSVMYNSDFDYLLCWLKETYNEPPSKYKRKAKYNAKYGRGEMLGLFPVLQNPDTIVIHCDVYTID